VISRHRWTGRYEAHLWDNSCRREGQSRKGRQGASPSKLLQMISLLMFVWLTIFFFVLLDGIFFLLLADASDVQCIWVRKKSF
jgi:hypothetical protein